MQPKLKIARLSNIIPLMEFIERKADYLRQVIENSGSIRNPFLLALINPGEFLLLEDAALLEAVRRLRIRFVPAQVIPLKKSIKIMADIFVEGMEGSYLDDFSKSFPRSFTMFNGDANPYYRNNCTIVSVCVKGQPDMIICFKKTNSNLISPAFFDFFKFLNRRCNLNEKTYPTELETTNLKKVSEDCLLRVSDITTEDLLFAARQRYLFPSGLLKFEIGYRVMGIDYPVRVLNDHAPVREKEQFLFDLVNYRLNSGYSEFIKSGVYLLNY